ncbi:hypothetical protein PoB_003096400 [Plakobranchus ocellatus]|uniref:Uncharacterized protein n=1 Tax=Plakobranchus ocellatus TaxID=259542 RepID=A0AAV4A9V1_9GAST|nr:hypothetical protein PoB_003096400 [Plakobranchus ocellatus]
MATLDHTPVMGQLMDVYIFYSLALPYQINPTLNPDFLYNKQEGAEPSYFDEHISLCELVTIQKFMMNSLKGSAKVADRLPFKIHRELKSILGDETIEVTKLGSGDFMVVLKSNDQAKKLGAIVTFLDITVTLSPQKSLNSSKGVIRCRDLCCCLDKEMVEEQSGLLSFDSPKPPS